ncbi:MAG: IPT/TIG domain-containing protein [Pseudomonadota bacterium]
MKNTLPSVRRLPVLCLVAALGAVSACGGGSGGSPGAASGTSAPAAAVVSISSSNIEVGKTFTVSGNNLERATAFTFNGATLAASGASAGSVTLTMPAAPGTGQLGVTVGGVSVATGFTLTAYVAAAVTGFAPAVGAVGGSVTLSGAGLADVSAVRFANNVVLNLPQPHGDTSVTFVVPSGAGSGPLTLIGAYNTAVSGAAFTVLSPVTVSGLSSIADSALHVTIRGANLTQVSAVKVGAANATIVSASADELVLQAPLGSSGNVVLTSPAGSIDAGSVSAQDFSLGGVDLAQVYARGIGDGALRLTPGRPAAVRASLLSALDNLASPAVTLNAYSGAGALLGQLPMSGPAQLPRGKDDYSLANTFNAVLPGAWVQPGLQFSVVAGGAGGLSVGGQLLKPTVGAATRMRLVLVPLVSGGLTSIVPDAAALKAGLARMYPYAAGDIAVTQRAPLTINAVGSSADSSWWSAALGELETARNNEDQGAFYYGFVADPSSDGVVGLGYVSDRNSGLGSPSAIGLDGRNTGIAATDPFGNVWPDWLATFLHEVGHNHSLSHVNGCGTPSNPDLDYPYADASLGPRPLYDSLYADATLGGLSRAVVDLSPMKDVMSYCGGAWLSDYSYVQTQKFAEAHSARPAQASVRSGPAAAGGYLTIAGQIGPRGVAWLPATASRLRARPEVLGDQHAYTLRVRTAAGPVYDLPFDAVQVADGAEAVSHFWVSLADPGQIVSIDVLRQGVVLPQAAASAPNAATPGAPRFAAQVVGGRLTMSWNAGAEPFAAVLHVAPDGTRTVLGSGLRGGSASLTLPALPGGGHFEVSLSNHYQARLVQVPR